jgi:ribose 5-phosphate isomerase A
VVERIAAQGKALNEDRVFIPTGSFYRLIISRIQLNAPSGFQSQQLILSAGLVLGDIHQFPEIDVTIDGADECDTDLNAIKGGGACHLREKVLAESAKVFVIVADSRKNSLCLGTNVRL